MRKAGLVLLVLAVLSLIVGFYTGGTYDSGDSIMHYLIARYAYTHPGLLLDHWGKPLFTMLSAPFAVWGWQGIEVFNCLVVAAASWFTYLSARQMNLRLDWVSILLVYAAPLFFLSQFSGLTEPLFALVMIMVFWAWIAGYRSLAIIILSFLPFVRSEGMIIMAIYGVYLLGTRNYRYIPLLLAGNAVYAVAGYFHYQDLLWAFHQNPYQGAEEKYGSGNWMHFINQLPYVIGFPLFGLLVIAALAALFLLFRSVRKSPPAFFREEILLLWGCIAGFIVAHSMFWALGLWHSFGLNRVLISIVPYIVLVVMILLHRFMGISTQKIWPRYIAYALILLVMAFPFTENKAALLIPDSFKAEGSQTAMQHAALWLRENDALALPVYVSAPYWYEALNLDPFDTMQCQAADTLLKRMPKRGSLVLWDDYFTWSESNLDTNMFHQPQFECIFHDAVMDPLRQRPHEVRIYRCR